MSITWEDAFPLRSVWASRIRVKGEKKINVLTIVGSDMKSPSCGSASSSSSMCVFPKELQKGTELP